jgi:hypothetical protein
LGKVDDVRSQLIVALVAVHALAHHDLPSLLLLISSPSPASCLLTRPRTGFTHALPRAGCPARRR